MAQISIKEAVENIEKAFGKGAIRNMKDTDEVDSISSGSLTIDKALGIGGFPRGRIAEIYSKSESSGKTTIAIHAMVEVQKKGLIAVFIDAEHAFDPQYAQNIGLNIEKNFYISQPDNGEQALEIVDKILNAKDVGIIVVDSVAALVPKKEIDGEMGDSNISLQARLMSQALRKLTGRVQKANTILLFINQMREKVGVMYGSPWVVSGGNALKFYSSIRLEVSRIGYAKDGDEVVANLTRVKVTKNKVAPPFKIAEFQIEYGTGISLEQEVLAAAVEEGIVKKSGSWFAYGETKLGQGEEKVKQLLKENKELFEELKQKIVEKCTS